MLDQPSIADSEYDALMRELQQLEADHPELVTPDSPTQRVGAPPSSQFASVTHPQPMLSLANARNEAELRAWAERLERLLDGDPFQLVTEPKIDGLAVSLVYQDGLLVRGATRGDGVTGEDVTPNLRTVRTIPLRIPHTGMVEVRGEIYLPLSGFEQVNRERAEAGLPTFMNPRNSAAGSLRQQDSSHHRRPPAGHLHVPGRRRRRALDRLPLGGAGVAARAGLPGQRSGRSFTTTWSRPWPPHGPGRIAGASSTTTSTAAW